MHINDEQVQRLLHGELLSGVEASARDHLGTCQECRTRLGDAEREEAWLLDRLRRLDHQRPKVSIENVVTARPRRAPGWSRVAAGIVLALAAAGVAYAAPGSPLPRVIARIISLVSRRQERPLNTTPLPVAGESQAGIAVVPGSRLTIVFLGDKSEDTALISLSDSAEVLVRALGGTTTFTSEMDRLIIGHQGAPARFEILIPRQAPLVEVRAGGRRVLLKENSRIVSRAHPDTEGRYLLPLAGSEP